MSPEASPDTVTELLAELTMAAPVGGAIFDEDLRFVWVNPLMAAINGRPVSDHDGRTIHDVLGALADVVVPYIQRVFATGEPVTNLRVDGELGGRQRRWEVSYLPLAARGIRAVGAVIVEVTERDAAQAEARTLASRQAAVGGLSRHALEGVELQSVLDETVTLLADELSAEFVRVLELVPGEEVLLLRAGHGWRDAIVGQTRVDVDPRTQDGYTLTSGGPVLVPDVRADPRFAESSLSDDTIAAGMSVVIRLRAGAWGVLGVDSRSLRDFTADDVEFLQAVANVVAAAIDRDSAARELERVAAQRRRLVAEALDAGERERRRVADQLHDQVLQTLLFARQECTLGLSGEDDEALGRARKALEEATKEVRTIVGLLHPVTLAHAGFASAVEALAREEGQRGGYAVTLDLAEDPAEEHQQLLLGLIRELLVNATKHAEARRVSVLCHQLEGTQVLEIADDGVGIPDDAVSEAVAQGHIGLPSAIERVEVLGGQMEISSSEAGTRVRITLPARSDRSGNVE